MKTAIGKVMWRGVGRFVSTTLRGMPEKITIAFIIYARSCWPNEGARKNEVQDRGEALLRCAALHCKRTPIHTVNVMAAGISMFQDGLSVYCAVG